jgi:hypothetical protein
MVRKWSTGSIPLSYTTPMAPSQEESLNTLKYANRAKNIQLKVPHAL